MSWSINVTGTKSAVVKKVTEQLDAIAEKAEGEEKKNALAAKERLLSLVEAVDLDPPKWNAVQVKANGSHNLSEKGIVDARMAISIMRTSLVID